MNRNETRTLWISLAAGIFAVFLIYSYTQEKSAQLTKKFGAQKSVLVAAQDIQDMETLDVSMVQMQALPVDYIQPGAMSDQNDALGLVAIAPIKKGEQILQNKIMRPGPITGLSFQVTPGMRALTIPVDETRGVAKLLKPGDRIDIVVALDVGKGLNQRREVQTLLQDVVVLATGMRIRNELPRVFEKSGADDIILNLKQDTAFGHITVEVSPQHAQKLVYILSTAPSSLFVTLRNPSDHQNLASIGSVSIDSVLQQTPTPVVQQQVREPAQAPPPPSPAKKKPTKKGPFVDL